MYTASYSTLRTFIGFVASVNTQRFFARTQQL